MPTKQGWREKTIEEIILELTDPEDGYGLFQGDSKNLTGRDEDGGTPVVFTPRETLTIKRMAEIIQEINHECLSSQLKTIEEGAEKLEKYDMGWTEEDGFVIEKDEKGCFLRKSDVLSLLQEQRSV